MKRVTQEKAEVLYHAGCRYSYDKELWPIARAGVNLLQKAGVDVGIMGPMRPAAAAGLMSWAMSVK